MSRDDRLDRRIEWTSRGSVLLLALLVVLAVWTLATVNIGQNDEMRELAEQNELLRKQNGALDELVARQDAVDARRDERLRDAIDQVEQLLAEQFAEHDYNVASKLNDVIAQVAALLGRPVPVVERSAAPVTLAPSSKPRAAPAAVAGPPAPSTTTTSPGGSDLCARNPTTPICRRR